MIDSSFYFLTMYKQHLLRHLLQQLDNQLPIRGFPCRPPIRRRPGWIYLIDTSDRGDTGRVDLAVDFDAILSDDPFEWSLRLAFGLTLYSVWYNSVSNKVA